MVGALDRPGMPCGLSKGVNQQYLPVSFMELLLGERSIL